MLDFFVLVCLVSTIFLIIGVVKRKYPFFENKKTAKRVYWSLFIISFIGIGATSEPSEQASTKDDVAQEVQEKTFEPELQLFSKIVDDKLEVSGETNLPDETALIITLKDKDDKDLNKTTTVKEGKFELEAIPVEQLKPGEQSIEVSLDDEQPDGVIEVIGEEGKLLAGNLVNNDKKIVVASKVNVPAERAPPSGDNEKKVASNTNTSAKKPTQTSGSKNQIPVKLVRVVDGDTIKIIYNGEEKNVRYLLIDTPETSHPRLGKQPFGQEAKTRNEQLIKSGNLTIEFDVGERVDKYGRLLAYVYVGGKSVQETLLKEGLARVAYVYPPNTRHLDRFKAAEKIAKDKKIGIWSVENHVSDSGFNGGTKSSSSSSSTKKSTTTQKPAPKPSQPKPAPAPKPSGGTESYKNCTELRKVYPNGVSKDHPAYAPKHDRDKDGWACER